MIHSKKKFTDREIESFELNAKYYEDTFLNGNKTHTAEELSELMVCSLSVFMRIFLELPKHIQSFVLNSKFYKDAESKLIFKTITKIK